MQNNPTSIAASCAALLRICHNAESSKDRWHIGEKFESSKMVDPGYRIQEQRYHL